MLYNKLLVYILYTLLILEVALTKSSTFILQASIPYTAQFTAIDPSLHSILSISNAVSLSLSTCSLPGLPIEFIRTNGSATILLTRQTFKQIAANSGCEYAVNITTLFARLTSPIDVEGEINLDQLSNLKKSQKKDSFEQFPIPVDVQFLVKGGAYESFNIQTRSVENGLKVSTALEFGVAEVFISHCADLEGKHIGQASYPYRFEYTANVDQYIELIEETSCPGSGALYHSLDENPPTLIVRLKSTNMSGVLSVKELIRNSRAAEAVEAHIEQTEDIHLFENETHTLTVTLEEMGAQLEFRVKSGSVSISTQCGNESLDYGTFEVGAHSLDSELFFSNETCLVDSKLTVIFSSNVDSVITLISKLKANAETHGWSWWLICIIVIVSTILVLSIGFLIHQIALKNKRRIDIQHATYNIPMNSHWM